MKKFIICAVLTLTACANGYTQQAQSQLQVAAQKETNAWAHTQKIYEKQCPHSTKDKPLPKNKILESVQCYEDLVRERVMPVAIDPTLVNELLANYKQIAIDQKNEKIDRDQATLNAQKYWNAYLQKVSAKGEKFLMDARQTDIALQAQNAQRAATMQALGVELLRDSQPVYAPLPSQTTGPRSTSCRNVGGTVICNHNY